MELIVTVGGISDPVVVERAPEGYRVRIAGKDCIVDWRVMGSVARSIRIEGKQYELAILSLGPQRWRLGVAGCHFDGEVVPPLVHLARSARGASTLGGRQVIRAYMPGRVVQVNVAVGDEVAAGQPLVVLEAMKMQNELQAEAPGRVLAVHVAAGTAVEGGDPLVELE